MSNQVPHRDPNKSNPLPPPLQSGIKSIFIEYQPVRNNGCCAYDQYVGILGSMGKKIRGWDHVRLVVVEGNVDKLDTNSKGQWWDLGITPGGAQCFYDNGKFEFNPKWDNKYTYFGFTSDQCTGDMITENGSVFFPM